MSELKEYIVTAKDREVLDDLCNDIETEGGSLYIPNRAVEVANERPLSRNTHYYLTDEEADLIRQDPRVISVSLTPKELGMIVKPSYDQFESTWDKTGTNNNTHKNWGLLRCWEGTQRSNWGVDGTTTQSGTVGINSQGRNVDVIIVDGHINPAHPEYAVNPDGTGGSRVVQYNWFQHNVGAGTGTYVYTPYQNGITDLTADNNHGAHVAGTACGNTQGWARKSNIYNISPYSTGGNNLDPLLLFDYIRAFHAAKPINPITKRKNPTIINNSWTYAFTLSVSNVTSIVYRGATVASGSISGATLRQYGVFNDNVDMYIPSRYAPVDADVQDAINDGIIVVGAAANEYTKIDLSNGLDYNNKIVWNSFDIFYHRGGTPGSSLNAICVGAMGTNVIERKANYSNCGPRVDVYAPGTDIMSSLNNSLSYGGVADTRGGGAYTIGKLSGTSMASPQVTGILACVLESYPNFKQSDALGWILEYSKTNQINDTGGGYTDYTSLQGSSNRYVFYYKERPRNGNVFPKINYGVRSVGKVKYPRTRIKRTL